MKKFRQFILPAVVIIMGAGAAFATNVAKDSNDGMVEGYYFNNTTRQCLKAVGSQCTETPGVVCTWTDYNNETHNVSRIINSTACGSPLYMP